MEINAPNGQITETESKLRTNTRRRIQGRFRATLAGLLELEVLRVRHKEMVEAALEKHPETLDDVELQQGKNRYWLEQSSFKLKLKRSLSDENVAEAKEDLSLKTSGSHHSTENLQELCVPYRGSRASSGFYECTDSRDIGSLSSSLASLNYQSNDDVGYFGDAQERPVLLKNKQKRKKSRQQTQAFSKVVIPEAGFFSVIELYPDSHWPDISDILQPHVILEPSYRSDLRSINGSEVYHYPSPLHAVALQSPLYAPQSQAKYRMSKGRCSPEISDSKSSSLPRPDSVWEQKVFESPSMQKWNKYLNYRCEEIVRKRAQGKTWKPTTIKTGAGIQPRRSMGTLYRTCSMTKSRSSFKSAPFQTRAAVASDSEPAISSAVPHARCLLTHKNRYRRHTAALTNLNIFMGSSGPLCALSHRHCSVGASVETQILYCGQTSEICKHK